MKIVCKQELNFLINTFKEIMKDRGFPIKSTRLQELFANSQGYKSASGLLHGLPITLKFDGSALKFLKTGFIESHQYENAEPEEIIGSLLDKIEYSLREKQLGTSNFKVEYSELTNDDLSPLLVKGERSLKHGIAFLTLLLEKNLVFPQVETKLEHLEHPGVDAGVVQRIRLPASISFKELHQYLSNSKTTDKLNRMKSGFNITAKPNSFRQGFLNNDAKIAKEELKNDIEKKFGTCEEPVIVFN